MRQSGWSKRRLIVHGGGLGVRFSGEIGEAKRRRFSPIKEKTGMGYWTMLFASERGI